MPPDGEVGKANTFSGLVAKVTLLDVFIVSLIGRKEYPSSANKTVPPPPKGNSAPWVQLFAIVKAKVPASGQKRSVETRFFLGYEGEDKDLPTKVKKGGAVISLHCWDKNSWQRLDIKWNKILPHMLHQNKMLQNMREAAHFQYTNVPFKDFRWDIIEYKSESGGNGWTLDASKSEGTTRYQVSVRYGDQTIESPGRIVSKEEVDEVDKKLEPQTKKKVANLINTWNPKRSQLATKGSREAWQKLGEACKEAGITHGDYVSRKKREKVFSLWETEHKESKACKDAKIDFEIHKRLLSNLRTEDYSKLGIKNKVHRISMRSDHPNTFVSYIEANKNVPWIFGSAQVGNATNHQTEKYIGFDCADLAVGAARAAKMTSIQYTYADNLVRVNKKITTPVIKGVFKAVMENGKFVIKNVNDESEIDIPFGKEKTDVQVGDLILFDWAADGKRYDHTTIIYSNDSPDKKDRLNQDIKTIYAGHTEHTSGLTTKTLGKWAEGSPRHWFVIRRWRTIPEELHVLISAFEPWKVSEKVQIKWNSTQAIAQELHGKTIKMKAKNQKIDVHVKSIVLPVHWFDAVDTLRAEINRTFPSIIIGLGMKTLNLDNIQDNDLKFEIEPLAKNHNNTALTDDRNLTPKEALNKRDNSKNTLSHTTNNEKVKDDGADWLPDSNTRNTIPFSAVADAINKEFPQTNFGKLIDPIGLQEKRIDRKVKGFAFVDRPPSGASPDQWGNCGTSNYICNQVNYNLLYYNSLPASRNDRFEDDVMAGFIHVPALDPASYKEILIRAAKVAVEVCAKNHIEQFFTK